MNPRVLSLVSDVATGQAAPSSGLAFVVNVIVPFVLIFAIFYFLVVMPQRKQQKKQQEMLGALQRGDNVITASGIYGRIVEVKNDVIKLEIAPKIVITVQKATVTGKTAGEDKLAEKTEETK